MPDTNHGLIKRFVSERLSSLHMKPDRYLSYVKDNTDEFNRFIDAVIINETYFFREQKHFMLMESFIFPRLANKNQGHLNFWSAACATGEEALSAAALAESYFGKRSENSYSVFASDLNLIALEIFKKGTFRTNSFRKDGSCFHHLLKHYICYKNGLPLIENEIKQKIHIFQFNLLHDDISKIPADMDIVFLRNILIYIPIKTRQIIINKIVRKMKPGGYLLLSSSETPLVFHQDLHLVEHQGGYFFQKKNINTEKHIKLSDQILVKEINENKKFVTTFKEKDKEIVHIEKIIFFMNQKLKNSLFDAKDNINYCIAIQFIEIVLLIKSKKFSRARELLKSVISITVADEISFYLSGYMDMAEQNEASAIYKFSKSLTCNASFWPSRFYSGMLYLKFSPRKAKIAFELCQRSIISYLEQDSYSYQFLLEGFHERYFLDICMKWVQKLREGERGRL
jgi:chemotaxis protein methyltransferase CheR